MSGATEATLAELLAVANQMNNNLIGLQRVISRAQASENFGRAPANVASGLASVASNLNPVSLGFKLLGGVTSAVSGAFSLLGGIVGSVVNGLTSTASNLTKFALQSTNSTASLSSFYAAFKDLPFGLGTFAGFLSSIAGYSEGLLSTYRQLTTVGASFSGNLFEMSNMAARTHMTLTEFANVVARNSDVFATMGGNVQAGINRFVKTQETLMSPTGPYASKLLGLGYTAEEAAQALTTFYRMQGTMSKTELADTNKVSAAVVEYTTELDLLTKITGKTRKDSEETLKKLQADELYQTFKSTLGAQQSAAMDVLLTQVTELMGTDVAAGLKAGLQTGFYVPLNEAASQAEALTGGAITNSMTSIIEMARSGKFTAQQLTGEVLSAAKSAGNAAKSTVDSMGGLAAVMGPKISGALSPLLRTSRLIGNQTESELRTQASNRAAQEKQANDNAARLAGAQNNLRELLNKLTILFNNLVEPIQDKLVDFATTLITYGVKAVTYFVDLLNSEGFKTAIAGITGWFKDSWAGLKSIKTYDDLKAVLITQGSKAFTAISDILGPIITKVLPDVIKSLDGVWKEIKPPILKFFSDLFEDVLIKLAEGINQLVGKQLFDVKSMQEKQAITKNPEFEILRKYIEEKSGTKTVAGDTQALIDAFKNTLMQPRNQGDIEARRQYEEWKRTKNIESRPPEAQPVPVKRAGGSLAAAGKLIESFGSGTPAVLHGDEGVVTKDQMNQIVSGAMQMGQQSNDSSNNNDGLEKITSMLSSALQQLAILMKENNDYTKRNLDATKELSGNMWA